MSSHFENAPNRSADQSEGSRMTSRTRTITSRLPREERRQVIVVGSGAGGLAAAVSAAHGGADVIVLESAETCGGASAWSGGWAWTPGNSLAREEGTREARVDFVSYLKAVLGEDFDGDRVAAFLEDAPEMVDFFQNETALQFVPGRDISDIYGKLPGAGTGHRSVAPKPISGYRLSRRTRRLLRHQLYETSFLGMGIMAGADLRGFLDAARGRPRGLFHASVRFARHVFDLVFARRSWQLVNGTALIGRLLESALDAGVDIRTRTSAERLVTDAKGAVVGIVVRDDRTGRRQELSAHAVILAAGGFPRDAARVRETFDPVAASTISLTPEECTGDGIRMALDVGAGFSSGHSPAAWCPVSEVPYRSGRIGAFPHIMDRAKPGSIGVRSDGRRFVNEANGYFDYVDAMIAATPEDGVAESWQIADSRFVRRYPLGMAKPRPVPLWPYLRSGYLVRGDSIEELARKCGIDPDQLAVTVEEFNRFADAGVDETFGRGASSFNRSGGDATAGWVNPSLGRIDSAPYYAVRVIPGMFGTFSGLSVDRSAHVLREDGTPIPGLLAAGSDQYSVMGGHYPAGGINLGPALTSGYRAGLTVVQDLDASKVVGDGA